MGKSSYYDAWGDGDADSSYEVADDDSDLIAQTIGHHLSAKLFVGVLSAAILICALIYLLFEIELCKKINETAANIPHDMMLTEEVDDSSPSNEGNGTIVVNASVVNSNSPTDFADFDAINTTNSNSPTNGGVQNAKKKKKMRKKQSKAMAMQSLEQSKMIELVGIAAALTLMVYLLLIFIPSGSIWLSAIGLLCVFVAFMKDLIKSEFRKERYDRISAIVTIVLFLAASLSLATFAQKGKAEGIIYVGSARIVGYDDSVYMNSKEDTVTRADLEVSWGSTWGCPHMDKTCYAVVQGSLCEQKDDNNRVMRHLEDFEAKVEEEEANLEDNEEIVDEEEEVIELEQEYQDNYGYNETENIAFTNEMVDGYQDIVDTEQDAENRYEDAEDFDTYVEEEEEDITYLEDEVEEEEDTLGLEEEYEEEGYNEEDDIKETEEDLEDLEITEVAEEEDVDILAEEEDNEVYVAEEEDYYLEPIEEVVVEEEEDLELEKVYQDYGYNETETIEETEKDLEYYKDVEVAEEEYIADVDEEDEEYIEEEEDEEDYDLQEDEEEIKEEVEGNDYTVEYEEDEEELEEEYYEAEEEEEEEYYEDDEYLYSFEDDSFEDEYWSGTDWGDTWGEYQCDQLFGMDLDASDGGFDENTPPGDDDWPFINIYGKCNTCDAYIMDYFASDYFNLIQDYEVKAGYYALFGLASLLSTSFIIYRQRKRPVKETGIELMPTTDSTIV